MTKTIRLDIEYPKRVIDPEGGKAAVPQQVSFNVVAWAMNKKPESLTLAQVRMWSKIQDRMLDENGRPVAGDLEISGEQFDFLYDSLAETKWPAGFAEPVTIFMDYLDTVKLKKDD